MAPSKEKKRPCCLFGPIISLFEEGEDPADTAPEDNAEESGDWEQEPEPEAAAGSGAVHTSHVDVWEQAPEADPEKHRAEIEMVRELTGANTADAFHMLVSCDYDIARAVNSLLDAAPGPSNRVSEENSESLHTGTPEAGPASPVVTPVTPLSEQEVSRAISTLRISDDESQSHTGGPAAMEQSSDPATTAPIEPEPPIRIWLNVQQNKTIDVTLEVDHNNPGEAAKRQEISRGKRPRVPEDTGMFSPASPDSQSFNKMEVDRSFPTPKLNLEDASPMKTPQSAAKLTPSLSPIQAVPSQTPQTQGPLAETSSGSLSATSSGPFAGSLSVTYSGPLSATNSGTHPTPQPLLETNSLPFMSPLNAVIQTSKSTEPPSPLLEPSSLNTDSLTDTILRIYTSVSNTLPLDRAAPAVSGPLSNRARPGSLLQMTVEFAEPVSDVKVFIAGQNVGANQTGNSWVAEVVVQEDPELQPGDNIEMALTEFTKKEGDKKVFCFVAGPMGTGAHAMQDAANAPLYFPPYPFQGKFEGDELQQAALWLAKILLCDGRTQQNSDLQSIVALPEEKKRVEGLGGVLLDGTLLCTAVNHISPGILEVKVHKIKASVLTAGRTRTKGKKKGQQLDFAVPTVMAKAQARENLGQFLKAAKKLGVVGHDLFQPADLLEKQDLAKVVGTLHALGRACYSVAGYLGVCLGPNPSQRSADGKKKWDTVQELQSPSRRENSAASKLEKNNSDSRTFRESPLRH